MSAIAAFFRHLLAPQTRMLLTPNGRMPEVLPKGMQPAEIPERKLLRMQLCKPALILD
jgi:hypothetical protein